MGFTSQALIHKFIMHTRSLAALCHLSRFPGGPGSSPSLVGSVAFVRSPADRGPQASLPGHVARSAASLEAYVPAGLRVEGRMRVRARHSLRGDGIARR